MRLRSSSARTAPDRYSEVESALIDANRLGREELDRIEAYRARTGASFTEAVVDLGVVAPEQVQRTLATRAEAGTLIDPDATGVSRAVVAAYDPDNALTVKLRALRSSLFAIEDLERGDMRVIVVAAVGTDDAPGVAANLATLVAQLGQPGLLVDANFAAPTHHSLFAVDPVEGVTSLLSGAEDRAATVVDTPVPNLSLIAAGPAINALPETVERVSLIEQVRAIRLGHRFAIVDAGHQPPEMVAAIARGADGLLLVVERTQTPFAALDALLPRLEAADVPVLGSILIR